LNWCHFLPLNSRSFCAGHCQAYCERLGECNRKTNAFPKMTPRKDFKRIGRSGKGKIDGQKNVDQNIVLKRLSKHYFYVRRFYVLRSTVSKYKARLTRRFARPYHRRHDSGHRSGKLTQRQRRDHWAHSNGARSRLRLRSRHDFFRSTQASLRRTEFEGNRIMSAGPCRSGFLCCLEAESARG
jgi:hypothetical protein